VRISKSACLGCTTVIALTKCDLVDETTREVVELENRETRQGSFLEKAPVNALSAKDWRGGRSSSKPAIAEFVCRQVAARTGTEWFRMAIDRVVHRMKGHGVPPPS